MKHERTPTIKKITAREILDSRGNPTVEVKVSTDDGVFFASVPSGASRGKYEAKELKDKDGGVSKAIKNIEEKIGPEIIDRNPAEQKKIDRLMIKLDGTQNKSQLGANAILAVSMAVCRAGAASQNLPLWKYINQIFNVKCPGREADSPEGCMSNVKCFPKPCFNLIEGGVHAKNRLAFQEFMLVPKTKSFEESLKTGIKIYNQLKKDIKKKFGKIIWGDEGGFAPDLNDPREALEFLKDSVKKAGFSRRVDIFLDVAASQIFKKGKYKENNGLFNTAEMAAYYSELAKEYPIIGIEDPFAEHDWRGWQLLTSNVNRTKILVIGDDLTVTNIARIKKAQKNKACNSCIIKLNQIGTVTEAIEAVKLAKSYNWKTIVSHRSAETTDDFIADFSVGVGADFIKSGAPFPEERINKYQRLVEIEKEI